VVRPVGVVIPDPGIDRRLSLLDGDERADDAEEIWAKVP
jgi:hypothetical protein